MSQRYIPKVSKSPLKLAFSLLFEKNPSARSALFMAGLGVAAAPFDWLFSLRERQILREVSPPTKPIVIVCGPPRSGTTLVAQYLINSLDVAYINNLTSVFPRSPVTVNRWWGKSSIRTGGSYRAFYGKSRGFSGANDALYIWDRWLGSDRSAIPDSLKENSEQDLPAFFGAMQALYDRPIVTKINRLNISAHLVSSVLPQAFFIFVERNPVWLAQSLIVARTRIGGDPDVAYGTQHPNRIRGDVVADAARQVEFHRAESASVMDKLPADRFLKLRYEDFCESPSALLKNIGIALGDSVSQRGGQSLDQQMTFSVSETPKLPADDLQRLRALLDVGDENSETSKNEAIKQ